MTPPVPSVSIIAGFVAMIDLRPLLAAAVEADDNLIAAAYLIGYTVAVALASAVASHVARNFFGDF